MKSNHEIGIAKRCSSFLVWRFNGERGLDLNAARPLGRQSLSLVIGLCIAVFCVDRAEAFRYWQEITVSQPGLVQARLPFETMEKARCREEIRLFNSEGEELPLVIQGLELGGSVFANVPAKIKYQMLPDRSVLTFSIIGEEMDGFDLEAWGSPSDKSFLIERSADDVLWTKLYEGVFSQRVLVGFPATNKRFFRVTFFDRTTPPLPHVRVNLRRAVNKEALERMPVSYSATAGSPLGLRVQIRRPLPHVMVEGIEIESPHLNLVDMNRLKGGSHNETTGVDWIPPESQYSIAEIYCPEQTPPFLLAHWGGYAHDGHQWLGFIPTRTGMAMTISAVRARVRPYYLSFQADKPGKYTLRFGSDGPATDPVLVYGQRQSDLQERVRKSTEFIPALAGPVLVHGSVAEAQASPGWDPLPTALDTHGFSGRYSVPIEKEGFQSVPIPAEIYGRSDRDGKDWRVSSNGRELPFLIRNDKGEVGAIPTQCRPLPNRNGASRWELAGPFTGVNGIYFKASVRGLDSSRTARITDGNEVLGEDTWFPDPTASQRSADANIPLKEFPHTLHIVLQKIPTRDTLFLEIDDGNNDPLPIESPSLYHRQSVLVFKAKPSDKIEFFFGRPQTNSPKYEIRTDPKATVTVTEYKAYMDRTSPLPRYSTDSPNEPASNPPQPGDNKQNLPSSKKQIPFIFWVGLCFILLIMILVILSEFKDKGHHDGKIQK